MYALRRTKLYCIRLIRQNIGNLSFAVVLVAYSNKTTKNLLNEFMLALSLTILINERSFVLFNQNVIHAISKFHSTYNAPSHCGKEKFFICIKVPKNYRCDIDKTVTDNKVFSR